MSAPVQLVFLGEVLAGFSLDDVQRELGRLLKADEARLKSVFSGRRTVLKRNLLAAEAERYVAHLARLGARVHVEPMAPLVDAAASGWPTIAAPEEPAAPTPTAPAAPAVPKELALQPIEPVVAAVEEEIVCPQCGERQSKRLLCRACATNMPMGIAAKLEEEERKRAERQALLEERRAQRSKRGSRTADDGVRTALPIGFSFSGRVGRLSSSTANLWLLTMLLLLSVGFLQRPSLPRMLLLGLGVLGVFFFSLRLTVLRCHDCDRHGWWALFVLVPYVGNLASLLIAFLPGNPEANEYGPRPPKGRWRWFLVAALALVASGVMMVRAGIGFVERQAAAQRENDSADDMMDFGSSATGGGSGTGSAGLQDAFRDYMGAPGHKAFAASSRQTYAWVGNAGSVDDAAREALAQCDARRKAYTPRCRVVHVNGQQVN